MPSVCPGLFVACRWSRLVGVCGVWGGDLGDLGFARPGQRLHCGVGRARAGVAGGGAATADVGPWCVAVCSMPACIKVAEPVGVMGVMRGCVPGCGTECSGCGCGAWYAGSGSISWTAAGAAKGGAGGKVVPTRRRDRGRGMAGATSARSSRGVADPGQMWCGRWWCGPERRCGADHAATRSGRDPERDRLAKPVMRKVSSAPDVGRSPPLERVLPNGGGPLDTKISRDQPVGTTDQSLRRCP